MLSNSNAVATSKLAAVTIADFSSNNSSYFAAYSSQAIIADCAYFKLPVSPTAHETYKTFSPAFLTLNPRSERKHSVNRKMRFRLPSGQESCGCSTND